MKRVKVDGMIAEIGLYSVMFLSLLKESIFIVISFYLNNHRIVLKVIFFNLEPWIFTVQYYYLVFVVRADRIEAFVTKAASCVKS